ncbi:MAG: aminotransferase class I/II-fold pyridoxal phosphate-dependent enzyme, partial [Deltaproteobacteria bacterium]|nr:aminotransferase class I/II-fold pyridoxal phosphate-dependent enzyme [Deltaproteobacteria bacterium]
MANYIRKDIQDIKAYTLSSYPEAIKLNQNEIPYDIPGELKAKVLEKLIHLPWNRYPLYQPFELRKQLAQSLAVDPEAVLISNGSNVLIQAILLATSLQSKVLTIDPTFSLYELEGKILGNEVVLCPLAEDFSFPEQTFLQKIAQEKPTAIFIANPNAPTANLFSKQSLLKVIE